MFLLVVETLQFLQALDSFSDSNEYRVFNVFFQCVLNVFKSIERKNVRT